MKRLLALASALGDRANPVVVREFRQAVQSQWVIAVLMLFLLINLGIVGGYLMLTPNVDTSIDGGRSVFLGLLSMLTINRNPPRTFSPRPDGAAFNRSAITMERTAVLWRQNYRKSYESVDSASIKSVRHN